MFREQNILLKENKIKKKSNNNILSKIRGKKEYKNKRMVKILKEVNKNRFLSKNNIIMITILIFLFIISILVISKLKFRKINRNNNQFSLSSEKTHDISIAYSLNNDYAYPVIVAITSVLYNSSPENFFTFYLLLTPDVEEENIKKISGLKEKYTKCNFVFLRVGNQFNNYFKGYYHSPVVYFRLELSNLINDTNKIIYLDVDTIVHKDLFEFYNLDMGPYYYMGFPGHDLTDFEFNGTRNFINSGCMLVNLQKLREINAPALYQEFYNKYGTKKYDEYLINGLFYNKISFLPLIYGIPDLGFTNPSTENPEKFWSGFKNFTNFTVNDMEYASKNRAITHNCYEMKKWWQYDYEKLTDIGKQWLFYASKSHIFDEICQKYNQFQQQCEKLKTENN